MRTALLAVLLLAASVPASSLAETQFHVAQVSAGHLATCAVTADHATWCWGDNRYGQLGQGTVDPTAAHVSHSTPVRVPVPDAVEVHGGLGNGFCARTVAGTLWCWGDLYGGVQPTPQQVPGLTDVVQVEVGGDHVCVRKSDGTVWCWGANQYGQLGDGGWYSSTPVQALIADAVDLSAGYHHTCAVTATGAVWCWGRNDDGQVGQGVWSPDEETPVQVVGLTATDVDAGGWHTCARATDGTVWCWGWNAWGAVGDGTATDRVAPVQVQQRLPGLGPDDQATWLTAGRMNTCAGRSDGTAWCWGNGDYGQLGNGRWGWPVFYTERMPARVAHDGFVAASMGFFHACAVDVDGALWCWGDNHGGQTGYTNPQQPVLGNACFNYPSCTWSLPVPVPSPDLVPQANRTP